MKSLLISLSALLAILANLFPGPAYAKMCSAPLGKTEKTVCSNVQLTEIQRTMSRTYRDNLATLSPMEQKELRRDQGLWLQLLNNCETDEDCIRDAFNLRFSEFALYSQITEPSSAGAEDDDSAGDETDSETAENDDEDSPTAENETAGNDAAAPDDSEDNSAGLDEDGDKPEAQHATTSPVHDNGRNTLQDIPVANKNAVPPVTEKKTAPLDVVKKEKASRQNRGLLSRQKKSLRRKARARKKAALRKKALQRKKISRRNNRKAALKKKVVAKARKKAKMSFALRKKNKKSQGKKKVRKQKKSAKINYTPPGNKVSPYGKSNGNAHIQDEFRIPHHLRDNY